MIENDKKENEGDSTQVSEYYHLKKRIAEKEEKERATAANLVEEKDESSEEPPPRQIKNSESRVVKTQGYQAIFSMAKDASSGLWIDKRWHGVLDIGGQDVLSGGCRCRVFECDL